MSKHHLQSEGMKALEQSLNDHMEICRLQRKAKRLKAENARLKAEVERLTDCQSEADRMKAENARLRASSFVTAVPIEEYEKLKAEVERLRKAGDAMLPFFIYPPYEKGSHKAVLNWNAAKEGKQP